jgi:hypothetical protein
MRNTVHTYASSERGRISKACMQKSIRGGSEREKSSVYILGMWLIARPAAIRVHSAVISRALQILILGKTPRARERDESRRARGGLTLGVTYINVLNSNKNNISLSACARQSKASGSRSLCIFIACSLCMYKKKTPPPFESIISQGPSPNPFARCGLSECNSLSAL